MTRGPNNHEALSSSNNRPSSGTATFGSKPNLFCCLNNILTLLLGNELADCGSLPSLTLRHHADNALLHPLPLAVPSADSHLWQRICCLNLSYRFCRASISHCLQVGREEEGKKEGKVEDRKERREGEEGKMKSDCACSICSRRGPAQTPCRLGFSKAGLQMTRCTGQTNEGLLGI